MISEHRRPFLAFVLVAVFCAVVMGESLLAGQTTPRAQRVDITRIDSAGTPAPAAARTASPGGGGVPGQSPQPDSSSGGPAPAVTPAGTSSGGGYARQDQAGTKKGPLGPLTARKHRKGEGRSGSAGSGQQPSDDGSAGDQEPVLEAGQDEGGPGDGTPSVGESESPAPDDTPADPPPAE